MSTHFCGNQLVKNYTVKYHLLSTDYCYNVCVLLIHEINKFYSRGGHIKRVGHIHFYARHIL